MWIVLGLGNPGREYAGTRHNLGFDVVDVLLERAGARASSAGSEFESAWVQRAGADALLVKPTTYVNRSGRVARQLAAHADFELGKLLVVVDDVALPFARLRLRPSGSAGGHNGLKSIVEALGETGFPRLRLGVGAAPEGVDLADWVLGAFTPEERRVVPEFVGRAADAVERVLAVGVEAALPGVNQGAGG